MYDCLENREPCQMNVVENPGEEVEVEVQEAENVPETG